MSPEYMMGKDGRVIPIPGLSPESEEVATQPVPAPVPEREVVEDELADLFEVPQPEDNDIRTDDLFLIDDPDKIDIGDLTEVSGEDREEIFGLDNSYPGAPASNGEEPTQTTPRRILRTPKRYVPPPPGSMRGIRY